MQLVERHGATDVPYLVVVAKNLDHIEGLTVKMLIIYRNVCILY